MSQYITTTLIAVLLLAVGITVGWATMVSVNDRDDLLSSSSYTPNYERVVGVNYALVFIGSSECAWSQPNGKIDLASIIRSAKVKVQKEAHSRSASFTAIGVAKDWDPRQGIRYLRSFGRFDEIVSGMNWQNLALRRYAWEDVAGTASTPQVILVRQRMSQTTEDASTLQFGVKEEVLMLRKSGISEIKKWRESGFFVPTWDPHVESPQALKH